MMKGEMATLISQHSIILFPSSINKVKRQDILSLWFKRIQGMEILKAMNIKFMLHQ